jgi:hypothetical protein
MVDDTSDIRNETPSEEALKAWLGASKLVDESGRPIVFFHGSPDASFTQFKDDQFFTTDIGYARRFLSAATSSSSFFGVTDRRPGIFSVHIRSEKPFDTRDPAHRKMLAERFAGVFGEGVLTEAGLPDWVEARDIAEWLREELPEQGFDAVIVDEGRDEAGQRPPSYVVFSGSQVMILDVSEPVFDHQAQDDLPEP